MSRLQASLLTIAPSPTEIFKTVCGPLGVQEVERVIENLSYLKLNLIFPGDTLASKNEDLETEEARVVKSLHPM
jgi:hypothetical protein